VVLALAALVAGVRAQQPQMGQCGWLLAWELTSDTDGWAAQSLDLVSEELTELVNITLSEDGEFAVSAVHARAQRSIFFFSTFAVYQYQIDVQEVVDRVEYDNDDASFTAFGYDDVSGHFWGSIYDDDQEAYFAAKYDPGTTEITEFMYEINDYADSTLFLDQSLKTFYHATVAADDEGNSFVGVNVTDFAFNYHYNVTAAFFETDSLFFVSTDHPFPNGNALLLDNNGNYVLLNLPSGQYNYVDPDIISCVAGDDECIFFPTPEPFYNYAFGFYNFDDSVCTTEGTLCLGFYDTLDFSIAAMGPIEFDTTGAIMPNDYFYYSDGC